MATKEFPNEWEGIPKETVADWLDHPCTRLLKSKLAAGAIEAEKGIVACADMFMWGSWTKERLADEVCGKNAMRMAYYKTINLIGEGEAHVKAE